MLTRAQRSPTGSLSRPLAIVEPYGRLDETCLSCLFSGPSDLWAPKLEELRKRRLLGSEDKYGRRKWGRTAGAH